MKPFMTGLQSRTPGPRRAYATGSATSREASLSACRGHLATVSGTMLRSYAPSVPRARLEALGLADFERLLGWLLAVLRRGGRVRRGPEAPVLLLEIVVDRRLL